jgi:hypothetical protein
MVTDAVSHPRCECFATLVSIFLRIIQKKRPMESGEVWSMLMGLLTAPLKGNKQLKSIIVGCNGRASHFLSFSDCSIVGDLYRDSWSRSVAQQLSFK